uniref:Uncharacterized protein n=1 Tax=Hyaloperonospora arabidopsidis (strain Emoy2) TaxID=559515 RepID=M4B9T0_HYAAE
MRRLDCDRYRVDAWRKAGRSEVAEWVCRGQPYAARLFVPFFRLLTDFLSNSKLQAGHELTSDALEVGAGARRYAVYRWSKWPSQD